LSESDVLFLSKVVSKLLKERIFAGVGCSLSVAISSPNRNLDALQRGLKSLQFAFCGGAVEASGSPLQGSFLALRREFFWLSLARYLFGACLLATSRAHLGWVSKEESQAR
jgi:hypothetical protein